MRRIPSILSLAILGPLLANCGSGNVVLQPQNNALLVTPSSVVLSMSAGNSVPFGFADRATDNGNVTVSQGSCNGIAAYNVGTSGTAARAMTIGNNPGVSSGGSSYSVSPVALGKCTLRLSDTLNNVATIFVTVTN